MFSKKEKGYKLFEKILTHGFVNDAEGLKMSKSKGNTVDPLKICQTLGADVLRIWVLSSNFYSDINLSENLIGQFSQDYLKTRNTIRFLINNLVDFEYKKHTQEQLEDLDLIVLLKLNNLILELTKDFDQQEFHNGWVKLFQFINKDLSNFYFDFAKNILYTYDLNSTRRRQIQTTLNVILENLLKILAPFLPHTAEEAYNFLVKENKKVSLHLEEWPTKLKYVFSKQQQQHLLTKAHFFEALKMQMYKIIETKTKNKTINKSSELNVLFSIPNQLTIFKSQSHWNKICDKFYCELDFVANNNFLNVENNLLADSDLKYFLQVNEIKIRFHKEDSELEVPFIQTEKILN